MEQSSPPSTTPSHVICPLCSNRYADAFYDYSYRAKDAETNRQNGKAVKAKIPVCSICAKRWRWIDPWVAIPAYVLLAAVFMNWGVRLENFVSYIAFFLFLVIAVGSIYGDRVKKQRLDAWLEAHQSEMVKVEKQDYS